MTFSMWLKLGREQNPKNADDDELGKIRKGQHQQKYPEPSRKNCFVQHEQSDKDSGRSDCNAVGQWNS